MISYIKITFFFLAILFSMNCFGQRWKNDPSHSQHNYKHPNKATTAMKADTARTADIQYVKALVPVTDNYKPQNQIVLRELRKVQVITESKRNVRIKRNYKQQFPPVERKKN